MKKINVIVLTILVAASLGACSNTFEGAGRDIERAGQKIQNF